MIVQCLRSDALVAFGHYNRSCLLTYFSSVLFNFPTDGIVTYWCCYQTLFISCCPIRYLGARTILHCQWYNKLYKWNNFSSEHPKVHVPNVNDAHMRLLDGQWVHASLWVISRQNCCQKCSVVSVFKCRLVRVLLELLLIWTWSRAGKWLRKKPRFLGFLKNLKNLKSPKFRFF